MKNLFVCKVALIFGLLVGLPVLAQASDIQQVVSPSGIKAWLIESHHAPVIAMSFSFEGAGAALDTPDKAGATRLMTTLLDEGAGPYDSQEFQRILEDNVISMGFNTDHDRVYGSMSTLSKHKGRAFDMLQHALGAPRFDDEAMMRMRRSLITSYLSRQSSPRYLGGRKLAETIFFDHPYNRKIAGDDQTLANITQQDIKAAFSRLSKDRLLVAVAGDISAAELAVALDRIFAPLPAHSELGKVHPPRLRIGQWKHVPFDGPQSYVTIALNGIMPDDPDWIAANVMVKILSGGHFDSRLMNVLREQNGLTYGVSGSLSSYDQAALYTTSFSSKHEEAEQAVMLLIDQWRTIMHEGVTEQELESAKTLIISSYPLYMTSTGKIANLMLGLQQIGKDETYIDDRRKLINAVTLDDVQRVAKRLLKPENFTMITVGGDKDPWQIN